MSSSLRLERPLVHCPFCKGALDVPREVVACARCGARHHAECFREILACACCAASDLLAHRDGLARLLDAPRRASLRQLNFVAVLIAVAVTAAITYASSVRSFDPEPWPADHGSVDRAALREAAREQRAAFVKERARLDDEWAHLRSVADGLEKERAALRGGVASELVRAQEAARDARVSENEAWATAEILAGTLPGEQETLTRLREALHRTPRSQTSLRSLLELRIDWEKRQETARR